MNATLLKVVIGAGGFVIGAGAALTTMHFVNKAKHKKAEKIVIVEEVENNNEETKAND